MNVGSVRAMEVVCETENSNALFDCTIRLSFIQILALFHGRRQAQKAEKSYKNDSKQFYSTSSKHRVTYNMEKRRRIRRTLHLIA